MAQNRQMKTATITEAKNWLSSLIDLVRSGESIVITDRGRAVATIGPVGSPPDESGQAAPPPARRVGARRHGGASHRPVADPAAAVSSGASAVDALLDERRSGR